MTQFWRKHFNQSGDTIVEVLIAVAVISSVLTGAFLVSQKSTSAVRNGQEHSELLQVLQGQVELVRSMALTETNPTGGVFASSPAYFCIDNSDPTAPKINKLPNLGNKLPAAESDTYEKYGDGTGACSKIQDRYNIAIKYDSASKVFTFSGRWDTVTGIKSEEVLKYRIYPGAVALAPAPTPGPTPTPSPTGNASIFDPPNCGTPTLPACVTDPPVGGKYYYTVRYSNSSVNDPALVEGCTWNWGDGTVNTYPATADPCTEGKKSEPHTYAPTVLPYPASCYSATGTKYTIVLTMHIKGVDPDPTYPKGVRLPVCK